MKDKNTSVKKVSSIVACCATILLHCYHKRLKLHKWINKLATGCLWSTQCRTWQWSQIDWDAFTHELTEQKGYPDAQSVIYAIKVCTAQKYDKWPEIKPAVMLDDITVHDPCTFAF
jgi:hypothetical protein